MKFGIDWSKVDPAVEPRLAALAPKPKVTAVTEQGANAVVEPTRKPRTKRASNTVEEA